jgi:hypothetical protein
MSCFPQPPKNKNFFYRQRAFRPPPHSQTIAQKGSEPAAAAAKSAPDPAGTITSTSGELTRWCTLTCNYRSRPYIDIAARLPVFYAFTAQVDKISR